MNLALESPLPVDPVTVPGAVVVGVSFDREYPVLVPLLDESNVGHPTKARKINAKHVTLFRRPLWHRQTLVHQAGAKPVGRPARARMLVDTRLIEAPSHEGGAPWLTSTEARALLILLHAHACIIAARFPNPDLAQKHFFELIAFCSKHRGLPVSQWPYKACVVTAPRQRCRPVTDQRCRQSKTNPKK